VLFHSPHPPACNLFGDPHRIQQVLVNILDSCIKNTHTGQVAFSLKQTQLTTDFCTLAFLVDASPGTTPEVSAHAYDSVVQSKELEGSGGILGSDITYKLVTLLGGSLLWEFEAGKGTCLFSIALRTDPTLLLTTSALKKPLTLAKVEKVLFSGAKLLVVEDNSINRKVILRNLEYFGCTDVDVAFNGLEAVEKVTQGAVYDLIFMDIQMPLMDGFAATHHILAYSPSVHIVALTAGDTRDQKEKCKEAGMCDYLSKPLQRETLLSVLRKYLPTKLITIQYNC